MTSRSALRAERLGEPKDLRGEFAESAAPLAHGSGSLATERVPIEDLRRVFCTEASGAPTGAARAGQRESVPRLGSVQHQAPPQTFPKNAAVGLSSRERALASTGLASPQDNSEASTRGLARERLPENARGETLINRLHSEVDEAAGGAQVARGREALKSGEVWTRPSSVGRGMAASALASSAVHLGDARGVGQPTRKGFDKVGNDTEFYKPRNVPIRSVRLERLLPAQTCPADRDDEANLPRQLGFRDRPRRRHTPKPSRRDIAAQERAATSVAEPVGTRSAYED